MARRSMADLAAVPTMTATVPTLGDAPPRLRQVPVETVAPNPVNYREPGDLSDLESMRDGQLQPCVVVTRLAFLGIYPEHEAALGGAVFVVVAGSRRRMAAEQFGLQALDVVVKDNLAASRGSFFGSSLTENLDRLAPSPLEEAAAVERLVTECTTARAAADILRKTPAWVSQRRRLLNLTPAMQERLRSGELKIAEARRLGGMPAEEQEGAWTRGRAASAPTDAEEPPGVNAVNPDPTAKKSAARTRPRPRPRVQFHADADVSAAEIIEMLQAGLPPALLAEVVDGLIGISQ
jgi:ParB family chromosome partitioning protein